VIEQLSWDYGSRREQILERMQDPELAKFVDERHPIPAATVAFAVEQEMALTLDDILWRRTGLGNTGELTEEAVRTAAQIAASRLGWGKTRTDDEIAAAMDKLARRNMVE
jgi:glycerol-3-phosphate dehydrogenase